MKKSKGKHMSTCPRIKIKSKGKHIKDSDTKLHSKIMVFMVILLLIGVVSGTSAYLMLEDSIINEFIIGKVNTEIIETFNQQDKTKKDVYIKNSGNVPIYVRVAIIINWKDKDGKILEPKPQDNIDYSINFSTSENWLKLNDGYYYYKEALDENANTDILIEECIQLKVYEEKILEVSIATQGIQAEPSEVAIGAWSVNIENDLIVEE